MSMYDPEREYRQMEYLSGVNDGAHGRKDDERYDRGTDHPYHLGHDLGDEEYRMKHPITVDLIKP